MRAAGAAELLGGAVAAVCGIRLPLPRIASVATAETTAEPGGLSSGDVRETSTLQLCCALTIDGVAGGGREPLGTLAAERLEGDEGS